MGYDFGEQGGWYATVVCTGLFGMNSPVPSRGPRLRRRGSLRRGPGVAKEIAHEVKNLGFGTEVIGKGFGILEGQQKGCVELGWLV